MMATLRAKVDGNMSGVAGGSLLAAVVLLSMLAPVLPLQSPFHLDLHHRFLQPFAEGHLLGTDQLGRDLLSRAIWGGRVTLLTGFVATSFGLAAGTSLGLLAGFAGGWVDALIMRVVDVELSIPMMLIAMLMIAVLGPNAWNLILVLSLTAWIRAARMVRAETLTMRRRDFVSAAYVMGVSPIRIAVRHLLPNVLPIALAVGTLELSRIVLLEVSLSFLGLGAQPPAPGWGRMLAEGRNYISVSPWLVVVPGLAVLLTVLSINLVSDSVRDAIAIKR